MIRNLSSSRRALAHRAQRNASFVPRPNVRITHATVSKEHSHLFSEDFLKFVRVIAGEFQPRYAKVINDRKVWQQQNTTSSPNLELRSDLAWIRNDSSWKGPPIVKDLEKRWVEITGPAGDSKMMINALNSGANCYMADLEDSQSPDWFGLTQAHQNLYDATRGNLTYTKKSGEHYSVKKDAESPALIVRARGLHMYEKHIIDESGRPIPAGIFN
jgi:malate synthase